MMTMWQPTIERNSQPLYLALAEAIERDIGAGRLKAGDRLPTHRDLARALSVTIGTITRGYQEAQKRGLTTGEVGRGSFIREQAARTKRLTWDLGADARHVAILSQNFPTPLPQIEQRIIGPVIRELADDAPAVISATWPEMLTRHQRVGAKWLRRYGLEIDSQRVLIATGFQPALWAIVSALCEAGDVILADQLTTPGLLTLAGALKVRIVGVAGDEHGMSPAMLERAIDEHHPRAVYLTPTMHTPTTITMPESRRREIAVIAAQRDALIIEDDDNLPLMDAAAIPTIASMADDRTFLVADVSRSLGLGVRLCYVLAPSNRSADIDAALTGTTWMPAPLIAELAARLIDQDGGDGANAIIAARQAELRERHTLARRLLPSNRLSGHDAAHHAWLRLPEEWRSESFAAEAQRRGVSVNTSSTFAVNRAMSPGAVRVCLGAPTNREDVERSLGVLAAILESSPHSNGMVI